MGDFNFIAPQFINLSSPTTNELTEFGEDYFDVEHEPVIGYQEVVIENEIPSIKELQDSENITVQEEQVHDHQASNFNEIRHTLLNDTISSPEVFVTPVKLRRSMSVGAIEPLTNDPDLEKDICVAIENLQLSAKNSQRILSQSILNRKPSQSHTNLTSQTKVQPLQKTRSVSRDGIHQISGKLKRKGLHDDTQPRKYISLAEAVNKFQFGTPVRYHSKSKNDIANIQGKYQKLSRTKPQSPMLATKSRARAVIYLSRVEQEQKEADKMKKHQLKAHPLNRNAMRTPILYTKVEKKPVTKPEPFKFAEMKYKHVAIPKEETYQFHARPVPKTTTVPESRPHIRQSIFATVTAPSATPQIKKSNLEKLPAVCEDSVNKKVNVRSVELHYQGVRKTTPQKPVKTRIEPFSFEERDRRMQQRKADKIKKFLEEEKKAREFHARPISSAVTKSSQQVESIVGKMINEGCFNLKANENTEPDGPITKHFKARPASVIYQKPFQPKKEERTLVEVTEFTLNTERRACKREDFEKKIKEKHENMEVYRKEYEENLKKLEMDEIAKIRKETVHKANPVKAYKEFKIQSSSKELTSPHSPKLNKPRKPKPDLE